MKKLSTLLAALFFAISLFGQYSYYQKARIIKSDSDILDGYVEKVSESSLNPIIKFKTTLEDKKPVEIPVTEIEYLTFYSETDSLVFQQVEYTYEKDTVKHTEQRLAKKLVDGYAQLYKLQLPENEWNIIFELNNTFVYVLLIEDKYHVLNQIEERFQDEDSVTTRTINAYKLNKKYQGKLVYLLREYPDLQSKARTLPFADKQMISLIDKFNERHPEIESSVLLEKEKAKITHNLNTGISNLRDHRLTLVNGLTFSYDFRLYNPQVNEKIAIYTGINYDRYQTVNNNAVSCIKIPFGVLYDINKRKIAPYLGGSLSMSHFNENYFTEIANKNSSYEYSRNLLYINGIIGFKLFNHLNFKLESGISPSPKINPLNYTNFYVGYLF
ncbi:MAG: hypothetical protein JXA77_15480 [Bacteroidales bacterium]|nr:hypothetical protein [Bacteroidales bacterium]MBN2817908.1 hypothetical protein [Bacteroidales bacterium]